MSIVRGTTPTFELSFPNTVNLNEANNIYVTFSKGSTQVTKSGSEIQNSQHAISVMLSQEETLKLGIGPVEIQANWTYGDGLRAASNIVLYEFTKQLLAEVVV